MKIIKSAILLQICVLDASFMGDEESIITQSWIWGPDMPRSDYSNIPLALAYPEHGFIQLSSDFYRFLSIDLVKRPTSDYFSNQARFCSSVLPAAIHEFVSSNNILIEWLQAVTITVDTSNYSTACKCYMRTLIAIGFNEISKSVVHLAEVDTFCNNHRLYEIIGKPPAGRIGHLPAISPEQIAALSTVSFTSLNFQ